MSAWTKTKPSPAPRGPWFKALAEKLKAWWEGLFPETGDSGDAETNEEPAEALPSLNALSRDHETAVVLADWPQEDDPLADWTALVAEGAPELLIPPEEGGTPWQTVSEASAEI